MAKQRLATMSVYTAQRLLPLAVHFFFYFHTDIICLYSLDHSNKCLFNYTLILPCMT